MSRFDKLANILKATEDLPAEKYGRVIAPDITKAENVGSVIDATKGENAKKSYAEILRDEKLKKESSIGDDVSSGLNKLSSYTDAPARSALRATLQGKNPLSAFKEQAGEDIQKAPSGVDIAADDLGIENPLLGAAVSTGIDLFADPMSAIPMGAIAKGAKQATKGIKRILPKADRFRKLFNIENTDELMKALKSEGPIKSADIPKSAGQATDDQLKYAVEPSIEQRAESIANLEAATLEQSLDDLKKATDLSEKEKLAIKQNIINSFLGKDIDTLRKVPVDTVTKKID